MRRRHDDILTLALKGSRVEIISRLTRCVTVASSVGITAVGSNTVTVARCTRNLLQSFYLSSKQNAGTLLRKVARASYNAFTQLNKLMD